jgi:2-(1,2-epoxy-1,2-dihydrophenyl)acetyl-CoA isomerase
LVYIHIVDVDEIARLRSSWQQREDELLVERFESGVVLATLNRPTKRNAITPQMFDQLATLCDEVSGTPSDRVLVITGAGDSFSSGADIGGVRGQPQSSRSAPTRDRAVMRARSISAPALALHRLHKPTIAAVNGLAAGAGCSFAMGCDLTIASADARFALIFVRRALGLDLGATWLLPRHIGQQRARYLAFTGNWLEATDAARAGMVLEVQPDAERTLQRAVQIAEQIAQLPPFTLSAIKRGLNVAGQLSFEEMLEYECQQQADCSLSADYREAIHAFREKREPRWGIAENT